MSSEPTTVTGDRFTVSSNTETEEQIRETLAEPDPIKEAASELGKKGGEASATKRAERKARQEPEEEAQEPASEPEKVEDEPEPKKPEVYVKSAKERMLEATKKEAQAKSAAATEKARADAAEKALAAHKAELEALKAPKPAEPAPKPAKVEDPNTPKAEHYETHEEWVAAFIDYKADQKFKERDEAQAFESKVLEYKTHIDKEMGEAVAGLAEYEKSDPGWFNRLSDEVKELRTQPSFMKLRNDQGEFVEPLTHYNVICDEIIRSKANGPKVMLYLTDHPDELRRLRSLDSRIDLQVEMRMLARTLTGAVTAGAAPRARVSKASTPVQPVTGAPSTADPDELDDEAPLAEFVRRGRLREASSRR